MTKSKPRFSGPHPFLRAALKSDRACTIAIQRCAGARSTGACKA